ncbi:MAG TPA: TetR/AcrR family transcriptional regulator [Acidimicrobiales bacterium]|nr:TetR/AcrR family transcriptional regulator [Acidimicrobiales bacterium]
MTPPSMSTGTKRRPYRRDEILAAAVKLFHERGYHATGMDDIGAEAGISGPAIYRHFTGKEEILEILLLDAAQTGLEAAHEVVRSAPSPRAALERLARHYVGSIAANPALAFVGVYERRTLSADTRARMDRLERLHLEEWLHALVQLRPQLHDAEARIMIRAVHGMAVAAIVYRSGMERQALVDLVTDMTMKALLVKRP